jgi:hypothetical protein
MSDKCPVGNQHVDDTRTVCRRSLERCVQMNRARILLRKERTSTREENIGLLRHAHVNDAEHLFVHCLRIDQFHTTSVTSKQPTTDTLARI